MLRRVDFEGSPILEQLRGVYNWKCRSSPVTTQDAQFVVSQLLNTNELLAFLQRWIRTTIPCVWVMAIGFPAAVLWFALVARSSADHIQTQDVLERMMAMDDQKFGHSARFRSWWNLFW